MKHSEAAKRYAIALFEIAKEKNSVESVLNQLRDFHAALNEDKSVGQFFSVPVVSAHDQLKALEGLFSKNAKGFSEETKNLLCLLVKKRRFKLLPAIVDEFQGVVDAAAGVARGVVRSAGGMIPEDRKQLEKIISKHTGKKVVMEYVEDKKLLGGLVAQVGTFVFDDSLETQLRLLPQYLRRSH